MHHARNMVGARPANFDAALWKRYFRISKHVKVGAVRKFIIGAVTAVEMGLGVVIYA